MRMGGTNNHAGKDARGDGIAYCGKGGEACEGTWIGAAKRPPSASAGVERTCRGSRAARVEASEGKVENWSSGSADAEDLGCVGLA